jgi:hypothetical protein
VVGTLAHPAPARPIFGLPQIFVEGSRPLGVRHGPSAKDSVADLREFAGDVVVAGRGEAWEGSRPFSGERVPFFKAVGADGVKAAAGSEQDKR